MTTNSVSRLPAAKSKAPSSGPLGRHVLLAGSESAVLSYLRDVFQRDGLQVMLLTPEQAFARIQKGFSPDVVVLQVFGSQALQTLTAFREALPSVPIVVFSCFHDSQLVVKAMKTGASDYFQLPFNIDGLKASVQRFVTLIEGGVEQEAPNETLLLNDASFVCASPRMNEIRGQCAILARVDLPVLIMGESGTGKEIIAQYIAGIAGRNLLPTRWPFVHQGRCARHRRYQH